MDLTISRRLGFLALLVFSIDGISKVGDSSLFLEIFIL